MDYILDDNTNHNKRREEKLVKRRKVFRVWIFIFPVVFGVYTTFIDKEPVGWLEQFIYGYLSVLLAFGLIGLIVGSMLSLFIWKDLNKNIRWRYLISLSTLVLHSIFVITLLFSIWARYI